MAPSCLREPESPRRAVPDQSRLLRLILATACLSACVALAGVAWVISQVRFEPITLHAEDEMLMVHSGQSLGELSRHLEARGMIRAAWRFDAYARALDAAGEIQAGEYRVRAGEPVGELLQRLRSGDVVTYKLPFVAGKRIKDILELLHTTPGIEFHQELPEIDALGSWLGLPWAHGEGVILPDTYVYRRGEDGRDLLLRAARALRQALVSAWDERDPHLPLESPYQLLILASLIEKESGRLEDAFPISRVFVNRLHTGMRLQADPTVIYGMGDAFTGDLRRQHLRTDTPYNTYTRHGLPPTPIAIVSHHSLRAAGHPAPGPWKYFVARGDGSSEFSVTLQAHNRAVRAYQLRK